MGRRSRQPKHLGGQHIVLTSNPDGSTRVTHTETFFGWLLRPFEGFFKQGKASNGSGYASFNQALKKRVEGFAGRVSARDIAWSGSATPWPPIDAATRR